MSSTKKVENIKEEEEYSIEEIIDKEQGKPSSSTKIIYNSKTQNQYPNKEKKKNFTSKIEITDKNKIQKIIRKEKPLSSYIGNSTKKYYSLFCDLKILKADRQYQSQNFKYPTVNSIILELSLILNRTSKSVRRRREKLKSLSCLQIKVLVAYSNQFKGVSKNRRIVFNQKDDIFVEKIDGSDIPEDENEFLNLKINEFSEDTEVSEIEDSEEEFEYEDIEEIERDLERKQIIKMDNEILNKNFIEYQNERNYIDEIVIDIKEIKKNKNKIALKIFDLKKNEKKIKNMFGVKKIKENISNSVIEKKKKQKFINFKINTNITKKFLYSSKKISLL